MSDKLAWGIISTGSIAKTFANGVLRSKTGVLAAVGSRSQESSDKFGDEFKIPAGHRHATYEALLADPTVKAVYIATPHPLHAEWAIKAAKAGKHILCEKPIGMNHAETMAIFEAAEVNKVFVMEAFMYRCHPQTAKLIELIRAKVIGEVKQIIATFSFHWPKPLNTTSRLTNNALGGGGILDVGCYTTSAIRLIAGAALGLNHPAEPIDFKAVGHVGPLSKVDEYASASVAFQGGILAQISTGVQLNQENVIRVYGDNGQIIVPSPWIPAKEGGTVKIIVHTNDGKPPQEIEVTEPNHLYGIEADTVAEAVAKGHLQATFPAMSWADTLGNMRLLDRWRDQIGCVYDTDRIETMKPVPPRPIAHIPANPMKYGTIPGVNKQISRLVVGADFSGGQPREAFLIFDDFFEKGGNAFDSSHWYGRSDKVLGAWIKSRGIREQTVILGKGAHTPYCTPDYMNQQILESIDSFQTTYLDVYCLHRDNPQVPVKEFVDALNEHVKAGRIRAFGGSNWSIARVQEANDYAASKGLVGFRVLSNNFSLARMVNPVWTGCVAASDPDSRAWLTKNQIALMPWSSQARGFFVPGRAAPDLRTDGEMVNSWYSDDNFQRRDRVFEMAKKKGVLPINIALAYVLCQPFPTFPLVGPRALSETRTSLPALDIALTPDELKWLNLEV